VSPCMHCCVNVSYNNQDSNFGRLGQDDYMAIWAVMMCIGVRPSKQKSPYNNAVVPSKIRSEDHMCFNVVFKLVSVIMIIIHKSTWWRVPRQFKATSIMPVARHDFISEVYLKRTKQRYFLIV
jgi:hypothetical protein